MKKLLFILTALVLSALAQAQDGLNVESLFDGHYRKQRNVSEVMVKGRRLDAYNLSLYRSLTVKDDDMLFRMMERLVLADCKCANDKEVAYIGDRLYYAFCSLPPSKGRRRYLFFKNASLKAGGEESTALVYTPGKGDRCYLSCKNVSLKAGGERSATLVYMEGTASVDELKARFKK